MTSISYTIKCNDYIFSDYKLQINHFKFLKFIWFYIFRMYIVYMQLFGKIGILCQIESEI